MTTPTDYWRILARRGPRRLYDELVENWWFDVRRWTDTQTVALDGGRNYVPSYTKAVTAAFERLEDELAGGTFAFYDLGCGKGKTLLIAAESGLFVRLVGIEIDPALAAVARANLGARANILTADATAYLAYTGDLVLYLYNPFDAEAVGRCIANLERSAARRVFLIYFDPRHDSLLTGWRRIHDTDWPGDANRHVAIFERVLSY